MSTDSGINDALKILRERYRNDLPGKLAEINTMLETAQHSAEYDAGALKNLHRMVHSLTGSGATFGLTQLSNASRALEISLNKVIKNPGKLSDVQAHQITAQWHEVQQAAAHPDIEDQNIYVYESHTSGVAAPVKSDDKGYILLVEDDLEQAHNLELQLSHYGYAVKVLHDTVSLNAVVAENTPKVIIMDVVFPEGNMAGPQAIMGLAEPAKRNVPVIFLSSRVDILPRLSAIRAGAVAYLTKPVDIGILVDKLDTLTSESAPDAYRALIVEDSPALADFYALALQSAGMETAIVTDPLKILEKLNDFSPELILMDMYMPGCSGLELAKVIRQQEAYVSTPIVFLSAETDIEKQLTALQFGADDFLTKPIQPAHLVSSVTSRIQRYRVLRSFMVRDSLTGLLNHTKIKQELALEIVRAQRQNNTVIFAMIDIDFFKKVNDTYGHPAGDRVIKSLSRLLQQRLRKSDVIGRYGGEEFAVILKDTELQSAYTALDNIRKAFEQIVQHSDTAEFSATFSCGLAAFPEFSTDEDINNAADRALYEAKGLGRNRVVIAKNQQSS